MEPNRMHETMSNFGLRTTMPIRIAGRIIALIMVPSP